MALHYLFLVVFSLMGMEGFVLYTMLVRVYTRNGGYQNNKLLVSCWGKTIFGWIWMGKTSSFFSDSLYITAMFNCENLWFFEKIDENYFCIVFNPCYVFLFILLQIDP